jgi:hypothetical protein
MLEWQAATPRAPAQYLELLLSNTANDFRPFCFFTVFIQSLLHITPAHCSSQQLLHQVVHYVFRCAQ